MTGQFDDLVVTDFGARFQGRHIACAVGRGGIGAKGGEGDGVTPVGSFRLMQVLVRPDRITFDHGDYPVGDVGLFDVWSDDPADLSYNSLQTSQSYPFSHERLRRGDGMYDVIGVLDFNLPAVTPGKGSAIFLHIWRKPRHPTAGCVAFDQGDLIHILSRWTDRSRVVIRN